jgi:hypothetical protein
LIPHLPAPPPPPPPHYWSDDHSFLSPSGYLSSLALSLSLSLSLSLTELKVTRMCVLVCVSVCVSRLQSMNVLWVGDGWLLTATIKRRQREGGKAASLDRCSSSVFFLSQCSKHKTLNPKPHPSFLQHLKPLPASLNFLSAMDPFFPLYIYIYVFKLFKYYFYEIIIYYILSIFFHFPPILRFWKFGDI